MLFCLSCYVLSSQIVIIETAMIANKKIYEKEMKPINETNHSDAFIPTTPAVGFQMKAIPAVRIINHPIINPVFPNNSFDVVIKKVIIFAILFSVSIQP